MQKKWFRYGKFSILFLIILALPILSQTTNDISILKAAEQDIGEILTLINNPRKESLSAAKEKIERVEKSLGAIDSKEADYYKATIFLLYGRYYIQVSILDKALENNLQAAKLFKSIGEKEGEQAALNNSAIIYSRLGDREKALEFLKASLSLARELKNKVAEATIFLNIGREYLIADKYDEALNYLNNALSISVERKLVKQEAMILGTIAQVYGEISEIAKKLEYLDRALKLQVEIKDKQSEGITLTIIGMAYSDIGSYDKALEYLHRALEIHRLTQNKLEEASSLNAIGKINSRIGNYARALPFFQSALELQVSMKDRTREIETLRELGNYYTKVSNPQRALEYLESSLQLSRQIGRKASEASALLSIGRLDLLQKNDKAAEYLAKSLEINKLIRDNANESLSFHYLMLSALKRGEISKAIVFGKLAVKLEQQLKSKIKKLNRDQQLAYSKFLEPSYIVLTQLLIEAGRFAEAQQILSFFKDEEFYESFAKSENQASISPAGIYMSEGEKNLFDTYELNGKNLLELSAKINSLKRKDTLSPDEQKNIADLQIKLKDASDKFNGFLMGLELNLPAKQIIAGNSDISEIKYLQSALLKINESSKTNTAAIYTLMGFEKYSVILVTPEKIFAKSIPIGRDQLVKKITNYRQALRDPNTDPQPLAEELYDIILKPIAKELEEAKADTLMWSLDGQLRYIPMATLFDGEKGEYLIRRYKNVLFTSANEQKPDTDKTTSQLWRGLGNGVSEEKQISIWGKETKFEGLKEVLPEIRRVVREGQEKGGIYDGKRLENSEFTIENFKTQLKSRYQLIHIASHFYFDERSPLDSFLVMGDGNKLSLGDIKNSKDIFSGVELLALSACETGLAGADSTGREIEGLAITAQRQGAKSILATLWSVNDESTRKVIEEFYKNYNSLPSMNKAEALRQAQLKIMYGKYKPSGWSKTRGNKAAKAPPAKSGSKEFKADLKAPFSHPYYWSPFILVGNWR